MIDPEFEFDAPMIHDFMDEEVDQDADKWFDLKRTQNPKLRFSDDFTPLPPSRAKKIEQTNQVASNLITSLAEWRRPQRTTVNESQPESSPSRKSSGSQASQPQRRVCPQRKAKQVSEKPTQVLPNRLSQTKKTSEDVELERISKMQEETKQKLELSRASHKMVKMSKARCTSIGKLEEQKLKSTIPQPYNLRTSRKRIADQTEESHESKKAKFVSFAAEVERFQKATPVRFRTKSIMDLRKGPMRLKLKPKSCVIPNSPCLMTRQRARATQAESAVDREEKEIQEKQGYKFIATPLNPSIIEKNGHYGVPQKQEIPFTVPVDIHLKTEVRSHKARESVATEVHEVATIVAQPMPDMSHVFKPVLTHKCTSVEPFTFEGKYQDPAVVRQQLSQAEDEKLQEERGFHANPVPNLSNQFVPKKADKPNITKQQAFQLKTEIRGQEKAKEWMSQLRAEMSEERAKRQFKAHPCQVTYEPPFEIHHDAKPALMPLNIVLNTDIRAKQRQELAERKRQQEVENEQIEKERAAEREQEERNALKELRNQRVHQAQPMPEYTKFVVYPSSLPPTIPKAPHFHTDKRITSLNDTENA